MNRKLMVAGALAAVLAIVGGAYVGRNLLFDESVTRTPAAEEPRTPAEVVFHETVSDVSLRYPGSWTRQQATEDEDEVALIAVAPDRTTSLLIRVSVTGLEDITESALPIVKKELTDPLIKAVKTVKLLGPPQAITLGGLPGYRYRYTYRAGAGAHDHYFLFKRGRMIALVFQATPASRFKAIEPQFERIAATFRATGPA